MKNSSENPTDDEKIHMRHEEESLDALESRLGALQWRLVTILDPDSNFPPEARKAEKKRIEEEISYISKTIESKMAQ